MFNYLNKEVNHYFKSWAYVTYNYPDLQNLLNYIKLHYLNYNSFYKSYSYSDDEYQKFLYLNYQFLFVELALLHLTDDHRTILKLRYVDKLNWEIISFKSNFSRRSCFYLRKEVIYKLNYVKQNFCTTFAPQCTNYNLQ